MPSHDILILGGGVFGVTAARELHARGYNVALLDQGPIPHPEAASTDINKVVRMEYGSDKEYMALADEAITGWHAWNELYGEMLYHETGVALMMRSAMAPGCFEHQSYQNLLERGHKPERLDGGAIADRFPAWKDAGYVDGSIVLGEDCTNRRHFDCIGFVNFCISEVWKPGWMFGYEQYRDSPKKCNAAEVSLSQSGLKDGDLVLREGKPFHIGLVCNGGQSVVNAKASAIGMGIDDYSPSNWDFVRRIMR